ncbi:MAG: VCBS repeat-containing protein [Bacteroidales bacterium]
MYIAIASGYGGQKVSEFKHYLYENNQGKFTKKQLPVPPFIASVIRPFDYNHDGYPEIFIGARVKKGVFPSSEYSWIIKNDKGRLKSDTSSRFYPGMVTDAVWTDYDKDGWEDLLVTSEYNSLFLLKNINGQMLVPQEIPELYNQHGFWYSIVAADFDKDGDDDYIIGNLGENNSYSLGHEYPLNLYAIDLDMDGILDPIRSAYWKDDQGRMNEYPVNYLDELREQSSYFNTKFRDYSSFSRTSMEDIMTKEMYKRLEFKLHVNTCSSYILWNDKASFRWEKLPQAVQVSPITKMLVTDLNGDTYPDVLLGGNDYTYEVGVGYFDASKGFVLINNGKFKEKNKSAFEVLTPAQSGLFLQGMVQSLLYFNGDTSLVVAGINRSKPLVFKQISGKK